MGILSYNVSFATQSKFWDGLRWSCLALWVLPNSEHFAIKWVLPLWYIDSCFFFFFTQWVLLYEKSFCKQYKFCHKLRILPCTVICHKVQFFLRSEHFAYQYQFAIQYELCHLYSKILTKHALWGFPYSVQFAIQPEFCHTLRIMPYSVTFALPKCQEKLSKDSATLKFLLDPPSHICIFFQLQAHLR